MKAMILAAGLGTRLRPLTADRPKALVAIAGRTLLEMTLGRLRAFGVRDVIVNVHHFAEKIVDYLEANRNFGMNVAISREETLLDTGGGLKKAAWFFEGDEGAGEPFILHNVDVISAIDLGRMVRFHAEHDALATLAVEDRQSSRRLLFDMEGRLCGRVAGQDAKPEMARSVERFQARAFSGIHVISPRIFRKMSEEDAFPIVADYLRLAGQGEEILAFDANGAYWRDLGRPEDVIQASKDAADGTYPET